MEAVSGVLLCLIGAVFLLLIIAVASAIKIVPEYERLVVFRLGRCVGARGPGVILLIPVVDRGIRVDLREQVREIPHQTSITQDNAAISVDFIWYYKVLDATESVLQVGNFEAAAQGMATTTLRAVIGGISLDDSLSNREEINNLLRSRLDEVTERWGVKVTNVEIREITPPKEISDAMNRQMTAERVRRALVTESTGQREAAINVADGEKQAAILRAEGEKQSAILRAEGDREAQILRAEGYSNGLDKIYAVAQTVDPKTMSLQYFDTLKSIGEGASTKYIFPLEFSNFLQDFIKGFKKE
jgi:regulator of protease activity HflC (stomatin/prohibitin superfamily)